MVKYNLMGGCLQRLHAAGFFRFLHHSHDFIFRDHQILIAGEIYKNGICQLCTEQRQHTNQKIGHGI